MSEGSPKRVIVYTRARIYYIICKKHPIVVDMLVLDSEFKSKHCMECCRECGYDFLNCEIREEELHRLIYYFRKKGNLTVPNPRKNQLNTEVKK